MSKNNIAFYNPKNIGWFDIGVTQKDKIIPFKTLAGVFIPTAYVSFFYNKVLVKTYTIDDGLTLVGSNVTAEEKTLQLRLQGEDFSKYIGSNKLLARCSFFTDGDIDIEFDLKIEW